MKETYTTPNMEIILFDSEDVITTSGFAFSANETYVVTTSDISDIDNTQWN